MIFGKHINRYYLKYGPILLIGIIALAVVDIGQLKIPEFYRYVINGINEGVVEADGVIHAFNMDFLLEEICKPMMMVILLMLVGRFFWRICFFGSAVKVEAGVRNKMFGHCKELSQQYYQVNKVGNLMSLFTNDLDTIQECFGNGVLMLFDALVLGGLALAKMVRMNGLLTLFSLLPLVILFSIAAIVGKYMTKKWEKRQEAFSNLSDFSQESFSGIAVIKAFTKELLELAAFKKLNRKNEEINVEYTKMSTLLNIFITMFVNSVICVILGYGGYLVYTKTFDAGMLVEFLGYFSTIVWPIEAFSMLIEMTARGKASLKRVSELLEAPVDVVDKEGVTPFMGEFKGDIEFKNLTFTYPGNQNPDLIDISFKINAGENVGLIGKTGCGKTSIVDLIARTYNVNDGELFVDGRDVNTVPIKELRSHIAYVPQDNFLFSDTIESNIGFSFKEGVSDLEKVKRAAEDADVDENIEEFPEKYATVLGERGVTVSGGQKQRISIARALLKDAEILIMDDSVSAVDTKTEKKILDALKRERKGKTTILIAHRVSTIEKMDKLIYVEDGRVIGVGTHKELIEKCPEYAEMVELQKLEEERKESGLDV